MVPPGIVSSAQQLSDDIRLRYSASSAVTNGLEECMEEAEHGQGTNVSVALEAAVLTILHEIGEDPDREVKSRLGPPSICKLYACLALAYKAHLWNHSTGGTIGAILSKSEKLLTMRESFAKGLLKRE